MGMNKNNVHPLMTIIKVRQVNRIMNAKSMVASRVFKLGYFLMGELDSVES